MEATQQGNERKITFSEEEKDKDDPEKEKENTNYDSTRGRSDLSEMDLPEGLLTTENTQSSIGIVRPKFDTRSRSSLKSVLVEYGLPDPDADKRKKKKKKRKDSSMYDEPDERDEMKAKAKQEHYMQIYEEVHLLRDYAYEDLMNRMHDKTSKQRDKIRKKSLQYEKYLEEMKEKEHQERLERKKKVHRVDMSHSDNLIKLIPKSQFYKLVSIEDRLMAKGLLKTQTDTDNFWNSVKNPQILDRYVKCALSRDDSPPPSHSMQDGGSPTRSLTSTSASSFNSYNNSKEEHGEKEKTHIDFRPLTQISETKEPSRPTTRDEWSSAQVTTTTTILKKRDPYTISKAAAIELDRKCPQLELPPMSCFSMDFGEKPPDPDELIKEYDAERRDKERRLFVKRLRKMYALSQSNSASAQRIFDHHEGEFDIGGGSSTVNSLFPMGGSTKQSTDPSLYMPSLEDDLDSGEFTTSQLLQLQRQTLELEHKPWLRHVRHRAIVPIEEVPEITSCATTQRGTTSSGVGRNSTGSKSKRKSSGGSHRSKESDIHAPKALPAPALSLGSIKEHSAVIEAKCLSSLWTNYAGKLMPAK